MKVMAEKGEENIIAKNEYEDFSNFADIQAPGVSLGMLRFARSAIIPIGRF